MNRRLGYGALVMQVAMLVIATLMTAPVDASDNTLSDRDKQIVECMVQGQENCTLDVKGKTDQLWPTAKGWDLPSGMKIYSWPALSGPSAAEVFRYYATQDSPGLFPQGFGTTRR